MEPKNKTSKPPVQPPPLAGVSYGRAEDMLEPDEIVLTVVHRSFAGLLAIYLVAFLVVASIFALLIALSPNSFSSPSTAMSGSLLAVILMAAILLGIILFTATYIYRQSRLLVTDKSLVQILQKTLFIRKVSRLSMSNVEDVNEEQRGFWANILNFGTLTVQTAGTEDNFIFTLCPNPTMLADKIIEARQAYARQAGDKNT